MLVLTWNLFHGRAVPGAGRDLSDDFAAALAAWEWDVALLQEVPPWWPPRLAEATGARERTAPTSRNSLPAIRRALARRWPDLVKSNGGGGNAILTRDAEITEDRVAVLRRWPERRVVQAVHIVAPRGRIWVANLHAQVHSEERAQADIALAAQTALAWAGDAPVILGGDLNVRSPKAPGFELAGGHGVDHVLARGPVPAGPAHALERGSLSDHAPVLVALREDNGGPRRQDGDMSPSEVTPS